MNIASNGSYTLPKIIAISADVQVNTIQTGGAYRGVGLGLFSGTPTNGEASTSFTGLTVEPNGTLELVTPGALNGNASTTYFAPAFSGFNPNNSYNLSYTINTSTGAITNVTFNGNNDTADFNVSQSGFVANGSSLLAGFYGSTANDPTLFGRVDNFTIAQVEQSLVLPSGFTYSLPGALQVATLSDGGGPGGTVNLAGNSLTVGGGSSDTSTSSFSGVLSDTAGGGSLILNKGAGGRLTLGGNNTYTGKTVVTGGTLEVTGSLASNGPAAVLLAPSPSAPTTFAADTPTIERAVVSGGSYAGLGSSIDTDIETAAEILAGANTIGTGMVGMQWRERASDEIASSRGGSPASPPLPSTSTELISDVLSLNGMGTSGSPTHTDPFLLEMTYSPSLLSNAPSSYRPILEWLNPTGGPSDQPLWENAIAGDDTTGMDALAGYFGSYAQFIEVGGPGHGDSLAQLLGSWGVDPTNDDVWAVIDHNSEFAVVPMPVPEPATCVLALLACIALPLYRFRRCEMRPQAAP